MSQAKRLARTLNIPVTKAGRILHSVQKLCNASKRRSVRHASIVEAIASAMEDRAGDAPGSSLRGVGTTVRSTCEHASPPPERAVRRQKKKRRKKEEEIGPLVLISKRGTAENDDARKCSIPSCDTKARLRYAKSSWGVVYLCQRHRNEAFERSFPRVDVWVVTVGRGKVRHNQDGKWESLQKRS